MSQQYLSSMGSEFPSVHDTNDCEEVNSVILVFVKCYNAWALGGSMGINLLVHMKNSSCCSRAYL